MFSALVYVFIVPMLEVDYIVVSDLLDEGVLVDRTLVEKLSASNLFSCTTIENRITNTVKAVLLSYASTKGIMQLQHHYWNNANTSR
jgi:hypothetical protein